MQAGVERDERVFVDHYGVLGLTLAADRASIKAGFRRLAKATHPDSGGDALRFLEVYNAYQVLSDAHTRNRYNVQYLRHIRRAADPQAPDRSPADEVVRVPPSRLIYPGNMARLAKRGLLRRTVRSLDRKMVLKINYDVELPLLPDEFQRSLLISIPVVARTVCPDCRGSDTHCSACRGKGSYKNTRFIRLRLDGGLTDGQILEIQLRRMRLESLCYFKKRTLRLKISRIPLPTAAAEFTPARSL